MTWERQRERGRGGREQEERNIESAGEIKRRNRETAAKKRRKRKKTVFFELPLNDIA